MTVTRVRAAIAEASRDKRITEAEAKTINLAAFTTATGAGGDPLTLDEARELADFFTAGTQPGAAVTIGAPAKKVLESLFNSASVPVGTALNSVKFVLNENMPFEPGPKLSRAPALGQRFEIDLGVDAQIPNGPKRVAYVDPEKKNSYVKLTKGGRSTWAGPVPLFRPGAETSFTPQPVAVSVTGGVKISNAGGNSFLLSGGIPAGGTLSLDLGTGAKVTVRGPLAKSFDVYRAIDRALPRGVFANTRARFFEEAMNETAPTDSRVIQLAKGDRPGELNNEDLRQARTLRTSLSALAQGSATPAANKPAWGASAGLFRANKGTGAALFSVPLGSGRIALIDPKTNQAFFAKPGAGHALNSVTGPVTLISTPAAFQPGRYFTWENLKLLQDRATFG